MKNFILTLQKQFITNYDSGSGICHSRFYCNYNIIMYMKQDND